MPFRRRPRPAPGRRSRCPVVRRSRDQVQRESNYSDPSNRSREHSWERAENTGWIAGDNGAGGNIFGHDGTGTDDGVIANRHATKNRRIAANRSAPANHRGLALPILRTLHAAIVVCRARKAIVGEHDAMANERLVPNRHAGTNKRVTLNLGPAADADVGLDLHERSDERVVTNFAAVEIYETDQPDVFAELDARCD